MEKNEIQKIYNDVTLLKLRAGDIIKLADSTLEYLDNKISELPDDEDEF